MFDLGKIGTDDRLQRPPVVTGSTIAGIGKGIDCWSCPGSTGLQPGFELQLFVVGEGRAVFWHFTRFDHLPNQAFLPVALIEGRTRVTAVQDRGACR